MLTRRMPLNRRLSTFATIVLIWILAGDLLLYDATPGWAAGIFILLLSTGLLLTHRARLRPPLDWPLLALITGLALAFIEQPTFLAAVLAFVSLTVIAWVGRDNTAVSFRTWCQRLGFMLVGGWSRLMVDLGLITRWRRLHRRARTRFPWLGSAPRWVLPLGLTAVFVLLFTIANPIIDSWVGTALEDLREALRRFFRHLSFARVLLWLVILFWGWAWLRPHIRALRPRKRVAHARTSPGPLDRFADTAFVVRCLVLFNLVFAVQTGLDLLYLWGGAALPEGMTYAQYAQRGAYPLIVTALLAALFVVVTFRPAGPADRSPAARRLVYLWIAQNILLTVSAAWRLALYVDVFSLTRLRVAAAIWLGLVALGLLYIVIRILTNQSNAWLTRINLATAAAVLFVCCFVNFDGFIASYNVRHCAQVVGDDAPNRADIDLAYLYHLGPESLPALNWLAQHVSDQHLLASITAYQHRLARQLHRDLDDWRSWTWRRHRLDQFARHRLAPLPPLAEDQPPPDHEDGDIHDRVADEAWPDRPVPRVQP